MPSASTGDQPVAEPTPAHQSRKGEMRAKPPIKLPEGFEGETVQESIRIALQKCNASPYDLYKQWDADGSGGIDKKEFARGLRVVGVQGTDLDFFALFEAWDTDGGGTLDRQELDKALKMDQKLDDVTNASVTSKQAGKANVKNEAGFFSLRPKGKQRPGASRSETAESFDQMPDYAEKIHAAVKANNMQEIDALRAAHKDNIRKLVEAPDFHGATPLIKAAMYGSIGALDRLLSDGASTSATDLYGRTPLMLAALNGEVGVLQALLRNGSELSTKDTRCGRNAFMWAILGGHPEATRILADTHPLETPEDPLAFLSITDLDMKTCHDLAEETFANIQASHPRTSKIFRDAVLVRERIASLYARLEHS